MNGISASSGIRLGLVVTAFVAVLSSGLTAQETLNNEAVLKMVKAGLSDSTIVALIQQQPGNYSTKPEDLLALKEAGVSNAIIDAMVAKASGQKRTGRQSVPGQVP